MDIRVAIGLNVRRIRLEKGISQEQLSFSSGLTRAYLSGLEAGHRNPTVVSLTRLATSLNSTVEDLIRIPKGNRLPKEGG